MRHPASGARLPIPLLSLLLLLLASLSSTFALQPELAGIVDWHKPLIGEPLLEPSPPLLVEGYGAAEGRVVTLTKKNVLAVLDAQSGELVWRQSLDDHDPVVSFYIHDATILLLSGPGASTARLFSLTTGHALWEKPIPEASKKLITPVWLGVDAVFVSQEGEVPSWVVLSNGNRVTRLRHDTGATMWSMDPGAGSTIMFKQIHASGSSLHMLALHYSFSVQTLVTSTIGLDRPIPKYDFGQVPSIVKIPEHAALAASSEPGGARVVWAEHGRIRSVLVNEDGSLGDTKDLMPGGGRKYGGLIDVGLREKGIVLGQREDGGVDVLDVKAGKKVEEFELSSDSPERSSSVYSATQTKQGVIVNRVYWSFNTGVGVAQAIHLPDLSKSDVITSGFTFVYDDLSHGVLLHATVSSTLDDKQLPTLVLTTSSGAIQNMRVNGSTWTREESLADITSVKFVDLGEPEVEEAREVMGEEGFFGRITRHLVQLLDLPAYLLRFVKRFTSASYTSALKLAPLNSTSLHRDQFGFRKLLIASTSKGKVFALDSSNGAIVWSRNLGLISESGAELHLSDMWLVRDGEGGRAPLLAVVGIKTTGQAQSTIAYHLDAYTGEPSGEVDKRTGLPQGTKLFSGKPQMAFLTPYENCGTKARVLAVVDSESRLHIFPSCKKVAGELAKSADKLFFTTTTRSIDGAVLKGHVPVAGEGTSFDTSVVWSHPFRENEVLLNAEPVAFDAISSFGRVLGDKSTLYKYLNPHLLVVSTITPPEKGVASSDVEGTGSVYVIDSVSGEVVYSTVIEKVVERGGVKVAMVENWLVYSWLGEGGWRLGSVELYEDTEAKGVTPGVSSFVSQNITAIGQTYLLATEIRTMGFTTSKAGITTKELIFVNHRNQVSSIARRALDPRRPEGKPTSRDKEEMLIPYDPLLPVDPKKVISHKYQVHGVQHLVSSPALVESTSLLFAYGQDLFLTRGLTPSGTFDILSDSFNKAQLLLTLGALSLGIFVAGPAVRGKKLKMKWY
ncbi:hypothetical protein IAT38_006019 [Cryptococcus sp. DSM 104549]